jgi:hypothetical protein
MCSMARVCIPYQSFAYHWTTGDHMMAVHVLLKKFSNHPNNEAFVECPGPFHQLMTPTASETRMTRQSGACAATCSYRRVAKARHSYIF